MELNFETPIYAQTLSIDHPARIYADENLLLKKLLSELSQTDVTSDYQKTYNLFNQISTVDIRYTRKENQLFPFLEKRNWFGPSQGMWRFQDENRKLMKSVRNLLEEGKLNEAKSEIKTMINELYRMTQVEELRLFPIALEILTPEDWQEMSVGESEIGWMHKKSNEDVTSINKSNAQTAAFVSGILQMCEGRMSLDQINWMLQFIPFDLTYVDENDRVVFYNRGEERVFPRSAGVIGREVRFCHPPKSVATVLEILEEFKSGRKDHAEFWIQFKSRFIHIRYFAVRDKDKNYRGVIEVSQDITEIKKLEGERRLLQWDD